MNLLVEGEIIGTIGDVTIQQPYTGFVVKVDDGEYGICARDGGLEIQVPPYPGTPVVSINLRNGIEVNGISVFQWGDPLPERNGISDGSGGDIPQTSSNG